MTPYRGKFIPLSVCCLRSPELINIESHTFNARNVLFLSSAFLMFAGGLRG